MSLQIRRGTNAERTTITPVEGELIYTTDTQQVFVGDGTTVGGINISVGGSGNITANLIGDVTGNLVGTTVSVSGNITGGNINTSGVVSAVGNVSGNYILGNGALLTGVVTSSTNISNGTSNVTVIGSGSNISVGVAGTSNVVVWGSTGEYVTGVVSATGNITGGNVNVNGSGVVSVSGNVQAGNLRTAGLISASGNITGATHFGTIFSGNLVGTTASLSGTVTGGDLVTGGSVSAVGNLTGNYIIGNGAFLTGLATSSTSIVNGSSNVSIGSSGSNVSVGVAGTANVAVYASTGEYVTGVVSATGNITGGNLKTSGLISSTGNITTGANLNVSDGVYASTVSASGTITGGNINTSGLVSAIGNVTGATIFGTTHSGNLVGTTASLSGTVTGGNLATSGTMSASGNITGGNIITGGLVSVTGTVTAATLNTTGNATVGGNLVVNGNLTYINVTELDISDPTITIGRGSNNTSLVADDGKDRGEQLWYYKTSEQSAFIGWQNSTGKMIIAANASVANNIATVNSYGTTVVGTLEGTTVSATGNITGGNLSGTNIVGTLSTAAQTNITSVGTLSSLSVSGNVQAGNLRTAGLVSATGSITGASLNISTGSATLGSIVNANANGVGNIGSSGGYFNTVFALATSAQYADLAENYASDAAYEPGTVVVFGGLQEVTLANEIGTTRVAGVVSTNPSYLMNAGLISEYVVAVALQGRVPTKVTGTVRKGDLLVAAANGHATVDNNARAGTIVGKALQDFDGETGVIEVVVGRT